MKVLSLKLPYRLYALLHAAMLESHKARSDPMRVARVAYLTTTAEVRLGSFAALTADLAGKVKGPRDLSANPRRLAGFGQ